jgi:hypothetical protein
VPLLIPRARHKRRATTAASRPVIPAMERDEGVCVLTGMCEVMRVHLLAARVYVRARMTPNHCNWLGQGVMGLACHPVQLPHWSKSKRSCMKIGCPVVCASYRPVKPFRSRQQPMGGDLLTTRESRDWDVGVASHTSDAISPLAR